MHALNNKCYAFPPAERWSRLTAACAGRMYQRGKAQLTAWMERGLGIRSSLLYYLRRNADKKWAAWRRCSQSAPTCVRIAPTLSRSIWNLGREASTRIAFLATLRPFQARVRALLPEQGPHFTWQRLASIRAARGLTTTTIAVKHQQGNRMPTLLPAAEVWSSGSLFEKLLRGLTQIRLILWDLPFCCEQRLHFSAYTSSINIPYSVPAF